MVDEDYAVVAENIMAQISFRAAAPEAAPQQPKAPGGSCSLILRRAPTAQLCGCPGWPSHLELPLFGEPAPFARSVLAQACAP